MVDCKEAHNDAVTCSCQSEDQTVFCCYQGVKNGWGQTPYYGPECRHALSPPLTPSACFSPSPPPLSMVGCRQAHNGDMTVLHARCQATSPNMQATWPMTGTWTYAALDKAQVWYLSLLPVLLLTLAGTCEQPIVSWCVEVAVPACNMYKGCWQNLQICLYSCRTSPAEPAYSTSGLLQPSRHH